MVDEEVAALGARDGAAWEHKKIFKELTNLPLTPSRKGYCKREGGEYGIESDVIKKKYVRIEEMIDEIDLKVDANDILFI